MITTTTTTGGMNMNMLQQQQQQEEQNKKSIDKHIQKQMGCMSGFFQLFDRHHILSAKRLHSPKRLPPSPPIVDSKSETETETTNVSEQSQRQQKDHQHDNAKTVASSSTPVENPTKSPLLPVFELKQGTSSSWKFAPRLSLDSRAILDTKGTLHPRDIRTNQGTLHPRDIRTNSQPDNDHGDDDDCDKQRRSPSVIARLMGLDTLDRNKNSQENDNINNQAPQLRRSASESRVNRELCNYQFIDPNSFKLKQSRHHQQQQQRQRQSNVVGTERRNAVTRTADLKECNVRNVRTEHHKVSKGAVLQRKSFFDSADFFPEPKQKQQCVSIYGELEKRLKMRGIFDEPSSKDLESLKHILEALQLKGLLHSNNCNNQRNLNFVYENDESPIVVMKPDRPRSPVRNAGVRRNPDNSSRGMTTRSESSSSPTIRQRRPLSIETQRRVNESTTEQQQQQHRRSSPAAGVRSPRMRTRQGGQISSRSPRNRKQTAEICSATKEKKSIMVSATECDESSTLSDTVSTCSQTDTERLSKAEEYREGRSLLERCDKLLHSIAEMTKTSSAELQPSPVSVLDSSFYNEESSPSPVMKRSLDFKELPAELDDDDIWSPTISEDNREDCDFAYISEVLRAWKYFPEETDVFSLLEKQPQIKGRDTSKVSILERKIIFDTINEILDRKRQLPPWKEAVAATNLSPLELIWSEFQKIRERDVSEQGDLFELICGVLKKDLAGDAINGWGDCPIEMSEAVLDIERLIFKDLIGETIRDVAALSVNCNKVSVSRRKLMF